MPTEGALSPATIGRVARSLALTAAADVSLRLPASPAARRRPHAARSRIGLAAEPNTFDPHLTVGRNTQIFIANVYDGLTARDARATWCRPSPSRGSD